MVSSQEPQRTSYLPNATTRTQIKTSEMKKEKMIDYEPLPQSVDRWQHLEYATIRLSERHHWARAQRLLAQRHLRRWRIYRRRHRLSKRTNLRRSKRTNAGVPGKRYVPDHVPNHVREKVQETTLASEIAYAVMYERLHNLEHGIAWRVCSYFSDLEINDFLHDSPFKTGTALYLEFPKRNTPIHVEEFQIVEGKRTYASFDDVLRAVKKLCDRLGLYYIGKYSNMVVGQLDWAHDEIADKSLLPPNANGVMKAVVFKNSFLYLERRARYIYG